MDSNKQTDSDDDDNITARQRVLFEMLNSEHTYKIRTISWSRVAGAQEKVEWIKQIQRINPTIIMMMKSLIT